MVGKGRIGCPAVVAVPAAAEAGSFSWSETVPTRKEPTLAGCGASLRVTVAREAPAVLPRVRAWAPPQPATATAAATATAKLIEARTRRKLTSAVYEPAPDFVRRSRRVSVFS